MRDNRDEMINRTMKVAKRIVITMCCCIPFLIIFSHLMRNILTENWQSILIYIAVMGLAVLVVELIARKRERDRARRAILEDKKDVFK